MVQIKKSQCLSKPSEAKKSQCLSLRGLPKESETHPDLDPSAIIEGVMAV